MTEQSNLAYQHILSQQAKEVVVSAIKDLVNADEIVKNLKFQLSGKKTIKVQQKDGTILLQQMVYHEPLMNDLGTNKVLADFRSYINPNVILSYFEKEEIQQYSRAYFTNVIFELARNMVAYDILSKENHAKIRNIMNVNFRSVLGRALNGMTLLTALKNIQVQEIRQFDQDDRSPGQRVFKK